MPRVYLVSFFSSLAVLDAFDCLTTDISAVGMYTKVLDRIMYLFGFVGFH